MSEWLTGEFQYNYGALLSISKRKYTKQSGKYLNLYLVNDTFHIVEYNYVPDSWYYGENNESRYTLITVTKSEKDANALIECLIEQHEKQL